MTRDLCQEAIDILKENNGIMIVKDFEKAMNLNGALELGINPFNILLSLRREGLIVCDGPLFILLIKK